MEEKNNLKTEATQDTNAQTNEVISSYQKWFGIFPQIPSFLTIALVVIFFAWGFIDPSMFCTEIDSVKYYGIFMKESFLSATLLWWFIGAIVCTLTYCITKLSLSYAVLHIYYLKSIEESLKKNEQ